MTLLEKALLGDGVTIAEANALIDPWQTDLAALTDVASSLTNRHFGNVISMCAIYPAKVGPCTGDCAYCAQSAHHQSALTPIDVSELNASEIVANASRLHRQGVERYSLVTSGESLTGDEFDQIIHIYKRLRAETEIGLCASLGSLTPERAERLRDAGVSRYHHNIETSRSYFPHICTTHSYDDKLDTIATARGAGMDICCGGIIAMGETPAQRVEMAFALKELDVDCVPINILNPIPGTRLENQAPLPADEILRTIAVFRAILPNKPLRFAGGRERALGDDEWMAFRAGINAMIVGNYLTTCGKPLEKQLHSIEEAGYRITSMPS